MRLASQHRSIVLGIIIAALGGPVRGQAPPLVVGEQVPNPVPVVTISPDGPKDVAADEVAGRVVDAKGKPLSGVVVEMYHWVPNHPVTKTDESGVFRFKKLDHDASTRHIRFRPENHAWQEFMEAKPGVAGWTVELKDDTRFKGRVLDRDGKPVPDAKVVADGGMRRARGYMQGETITEVKTGPDGAYLLFVAPGKFDIRVRVAGSGVASVQESIEEGQAKGLDLKLAPGVKFLAQCLDHNTGQPVVGVKLTHWMKPGIEGSSDEKGLILIKDVPPGKYPRFQVEAKGYARWWSSECATEWSRLQKDKGFQRNFDGLDFDITPEFGPVMIEMEQAVTIRGRVFDPDGKPVAGATVAPAKTGSGNSLTGDTRFSVATDKDGRYECELPASGLEEYNLIAHDGKYGEWRTWANGASATMMTRPGQMKKDFDLKLNRPATVTGRVVDAKGKPVAGREVQSAPTALDENRYYVPTTKTDKDGKYTLKFVRPGENFVQVAPFWLLAKDAPLGTAKVVTAKAGEVSEGVDLIARPER